MHKTWIEMMRQEMNNIWASEGSPSQIIIIIIISISLYKKEKILWSLLVICFTMCIKLPHKRTQEEYVKKKKEGILGNGEIFYCYFFIILCIISANNPAARRHSWIKNTHWILECCWKSQSNTNDVLLSHCFENKCANYKWRQETLL